MVEVLSRQPLFNRKTEFDHADKVIDYRSLQDSNSATEGRRAIATLPGSYISMHTFASLVYALTRERDILRREQNKRSDANALLKEKDEIITQVLPDYIGYVQIIDYEKVCMLEEADDITKLRPVMDINFWGSVYTTKFAAPHLRNCGGRLIVLSATASWIPVPISQITLAENASFEGILGSETTKAMMERFKRGKIREKRCKEREMERRLKAEDAAVGKMSKINRDRDHEISEIVALCTYHDKLPNVGMKHQNLDEGSKAKDDEVSREG
ncbi:hydroxysteroid dehydrogenase 1 [Artemisia annua]|uniref:Hydroxysteroid dehydrogenase 1 n=1 Tax=Artemisia annua TaxID=35608 RepID=A0A2U1PVF3_ARTAN|nr:hydroxysteroid dehydrogenase 1 [Artemisia annua]